MKAGWLKKQAAVTAGSGALVRLMGFGLRLWMSRQLGAEALGILELASSAHALAVTPAAAGIPGAVSRLAARAETEEESARALACGRRLAGRLGFALSAAFLALSPLLARWLGDGRAWPALALFSPCPLLIAVSGACDGYFFGRGRALPPNLSELGEQLIRLGVFGAFCFLMPALSPAQRAAVPALGALLGECGGLAIVLKAAPPAPRGETDGPGPEKRLIRLALPLTANRLVHTGLRSLSAVVIPLRLAAGGAGHAEALKAFGMMNGMVMPLTFLPLLFTGALAAVGGPAAARCRTAGARRRLAGKMLAAALGAGAACAGALFAGAPLIAGRLYRIPELAPLIRLACPLAVILAVQQAASGLMTGLGLQKKALLAALPGSALTLLLTWLKTPALGVAGAMEASLLGHGLTLIWCLICLVSRLAEKPRS